MWLAGNTPVRIVVTKEISMRFRLLFTLAALVASHANAASIIKYDPSRRMIFLREVNTSSVMLEEPVCIYAGTTLMGCGRVSAISSSAASVSMDEMKMQPYAGTEVSMKSSRRSPSSTADVSETFNKNQASKTLGLALGITAGTKYFYPNAHIQLVVSRDWTVGLMPMFANYSANSNSVSGYGGYLTVSYYHTHSALRGLEFEGGIGYFSIKGVAGAIEETGSGLGGKATVGWRGKALWDLGLDLGVAGGLQYLNIQTATLETSFNGLLPMITAYVGYSF